MPGTFDRREQIIACAAAAFASRGVAATTVRHIADEVGILSGSLYHHFESKEAIVEAILGPYVADLRERYRVGLAATGGARSRLRNLIHASLTTSADHPHATEIYQNDANYLSGVPRFRYLKEVRREVQTSWLEVLQAGVASGELRSDLDPRVCYRLVRDAVWLSVRWFHPSKEYPASKLADECATVFLDGLIRPHG